MQNHVSPTKPQNQDFFLALQKHVFPQYINLCFGKKTPFYGFDGKCNFMVLLRKHVFTVLAGNIIFGFGEKCNFIATMRNTQFCCFDKKTWFVDLTENRDISVLAEKRELTVVTEKHEFTVLTKTVTLRFWEKCDFAVRQENIILLSTNTLCLLSTCTHFIMYTYSTHFRNCSSKLTV